MHYQEDTPLLIITERGYAAGLRALDRYNRQVASQTISLAKSPSGVWGGNNEGGAAVVAQ